MIHYHGCSDSGRQYDTARALAGRHILVSFAYPHHLPMLAGVVSSFVLDNGAYTTWKKGKKYDLQGYLKWVELWHRHPGFDWALIPDKIDGDERDNNALLREWPTDYRTFGVPVWHLHESLERLKLLVSGFRRIAFGSSGEWPTPGKPGWWQRIAEAMAVVCDKEGRPQKKLHGLRMLNPSIFRHLPFASADSTHVLRTAYDKRGCWNGPYPPASQWVKSLILADRIESHQSATVWAGIPRLTAARLATPLFGEDDPCRTTNTNPMATKSAGPPTT